MMKVELASHAVALNLAGVLAMDASDYGAAIESFSRALGALKRVITLQPDSAHGTHPPSSCRPTAHVPESLLENCFSFSEAATATRRKEAGGFVFRCPIAVAITASPRVVRCHRFHVMLSFALLYNLGLAHHLSALEEEEEPSRAQLQKALSLYELAFSVHVNEDVSLSILQTMVIASNLGQVYASLGASDKALQCCSHLLSLILYASGMCERDRPESLDNFVGNVMHLLLKDGGSNAPAA
jgi:tetratricopeptide (TPR) repeat protein